MPNETCFSVAFSSALRALVQIARAALRVVPTTSALHQPATHGKRRTMQTRRTQWLREDASAFSASTRRVAAEKQRKITTSTEKARRRCVNAPNGDEISVVAVPLDELASDLRTTIN